VLIPDEKMLAVFKAVRDFVVFTDKRLIAVNVQGMTGKKRDFSSLPYNNWPSA
jgi:PH (Pleckstrin Homology) domain-containing protein